MNPTASYGCTPPPQAALGDDLLRGAGAIAKFLFGDRTQRRKVHYLTGEALVRMPHFRLARKSTLLRWIEDRERGCISDG